MNDASTAPEKTAFTLVLASDRMGTGDDGLGTKLMKNYLKTLNDTGLVPEAVLLYNGGVRLAAEGSAVLSELKGLELAGARVLSCGTCLDHFKLRESLKAGVVSNMVEIATRMARADRLVRP